MTKETLSQKADRMWDAYDKMLPFFTAGELEDYRKRMPTPSEIFAEEFTRELLEWKEETE